MSPLYWDTLQGHAKRELIVTGALSGIAQQLNLILRLTLSDVPPRIVADLETLHRQAYEALDQARTIR